MEFKNSTSILFSKFGLIYQIIIYVFIVFLIAGLIGMGVMVPVERKLLSRDDIQSEIQQFESEWNSLVEGEGSVRKVLNAAKEGLANVWEILKSDKGLMAAVIVSAILLYLLVRFLLSLMSLPIADITNDFMSSGMKTRFLGSYVKNFKASAKFALAYTIVTAPVSVGIFFVIAGIILGLTSVIGIFAFALALGVGILLGSIKALLLAGWLPVYMSSEDKKVWAALKEGFECVTKKKWNDILGGMMALYFIIYSLIAVLSLPTFGIFSVIGAAIYILAYRILELTFYYSVNGKRFYIDGNTFVDPREMALRTEYQSAYPEGEDAEKIEEESEQEKAEVADVETESESSDENSAEALKTSAAVADGEKEDAPKGEDMSKTNGGTAGIEG